MWCRYSTLVRFGVTITLLLGSGTAIAQIDGRVQTDPQRAYSSFSADAHRQFDFWIGQWDVTLRMREEDGQFHDRVQARANIYSILHGRAILEMWDSESIKGYSLRYLDEQTQQWVIWHNWLGENWSKSSSLQGGFRHGRGEFVTKNFDQDGQVVLQRHMFSDITPFSLLWSDLKSNDGGHSWQESRRMEFTRTNKQPHWPLESLYFPTYDDGSRCLAEEFRAYESLAGHWHGRIGRHKTSISSWQVLGGCGVIVFLDIESRVPTKRFMFIRYDSDESHWETAYLSDDSAGQMLRLVGTEAWSDSSDGASHLRWHFNGSDVLDYAFSGADGTIEAGRFERQELIGH